MSKAKDILLKDTHTYKAALAKFHRGQRQFGRASQYTFEEVADSRIITVVGEEKCFLLKIRSEQGNENEVNIIDVNKVMIKCDHDRHGQFYMLGFEVPKEELPELAELPLFSEMIDKIERNHILVALDMRKEMEPVKYRLDNSGMYHKVRWSIHD